MISRIRENFAQFVESMNVKKEEILKQNKFISLENLLSFYEENKKILLDKKENLLAALNKYFPNINLNINLKFNLDLSFLEKLEIDNIDEIVEKLEQFYEANYIEPVESNLRKKVVEKFAGFKKGCTFAPVKQNNIGLVAQLNSASDYGSEGYRFESCRGHKK